MLQQTSFLDSLFGRTSPEPSAVTEAKTSGQSSRRSAKQQDGGVLFINLKNGNTLVPSWEKVSALPGVSTTLNFGESPSEGRESTLLQILEANAPEKYYLSPKACRGILNRAERRGKRLPEMLLEALKEVLTLAGFMEKPQRQQAQPDIGGGYRQPLKPDRKPTSFTACKETESTEQTQQDVMGKDGARGGIVHLEHDRPSGGCLLY